MTKKHQIGSSMVEVVVAMVVVALGLLGHASLIAVSAKDNHAAFLRSQATMLAYDITERLRGNPTLAKAGEFNINLAANVPNGATIQLQELRDWRANIQQALPSGDGSVTVNFQGFVTVVITWMETVDGSTTTFSTQTVI